MLRNAEHDNYEPDEWSNRSQRVRHQNNYHMNNNEPGNAVFTNVASAPSFVPNASNVAEPSPFSVSQVSQVATFTPKQDRGGASHQNVHQVNPFISSNSSSSNHEI